MKIERYAVSWAESVPYGSIGVMGIYDTVEAAKKEIEQAILEDIDYELGTYQDADTGEFHDLPEELDKPEEELLKDWMETRGPTTIIENGVEDKQYTYSIDKREFSIDPYELLNSHRASQRASHGDSQENIRGRGKIPIEKYVVVRVECNEEQYDAGVSGVTLRALGIYDTREEAKEAIELTVLEDIDNELKQSPEELNKPREEILKDWLEALGQYTFIENCPDGTRCTYDVNKIEYFIDPYEFINR